MKAKVYLKMLACLVGLLTFYSCNNDLEQDKNASVEAQQVQTDRRSLFKRMLMQIILNL